MVTLLVTVVGLAVGLGWSLGLAVVDWAAWVLVLPSRRPGALAAQVNFALNVGSPERRLGDPIEAEAFDGVPLAGLWHAAGRADGLRRGTVLVIHGFAEDPSGLHDRMAALNAHGWDVAALDARAHGRSGGDRGTFGAREAGDVSAWIAALAASGRIPAGSAVAVWGRSMGAAIATRAAAGDPRVAALVLEAPYAGLAETLIHVLRRKRVPLPRAFGGLVLRRAARLAGASLSDPRPIDLAPEVRAPVLVVHGTADSLISVAEVRGLASAFAGPAAVIEVLGGGHNTVVSVGGPPLLDRIASFLDGAVAARGRGAEETAESGVDAVRS